MNLPVDFSNIPGRETLARTQVLQAYLAGCPGPVRGRDRSGLLLCGRQVAKYWFGHPVPEIVISLSPRALPLYAFYSIVRIGLAYLLSLLFAIGYGYLAAYNKRIEPLMIAGLDILQSIPVLSFLPGVMLAMVRSLPDAPDRRRDGSDSADLHRPGVEYGVQLLFLAQEYSSRADARPAGIYKFSRWQRLVQLELAVFSDWPGVELDGLCGGRMVLPDGLRDVRPGDVGTFGCPGWARICRRRPDWAT